MRKIKKCLYSFLVSLLTISQLLSNTVYANDTVSIKIDKVGNGIVSVFENDQVHEMQQETLELEVPIESEVKVKAVATDSKIDIFSLNNQVVEGFDGEKEQFEYTFKVTNKTDIFIGFKTIENKLVQKEEPVNEEKETTQQDEIFKEFFDGVAGGNHFYTQEEIQYNESLALSWINQKTKPKTRKMTRSLMIEDLSYHVWQNGQGTLNNGLWKLSDGSLAFCAQGLNASPNVGDSVSDPYITENANVRKALYYGYGGPGDVLTSKYGVSGAIVITNDLTSYAYCGNSIGYTLSQGYHWKNGLQSIYTQIMSYPDPKDKGYSAYIVNVEGTGTNWQGQVADKQCLAFLGKAPYGKLKLKKGIANEEISSNNNCYSLEGAKYGLYTDQQLTNQIGTFTIDKNGNSNEIDELQGGTYYVKEIKAPQGYALDIRVYNVNVVSNQLITLEVKDYAQSDPIGILLRKVDSHTNEANSLLKDAQFVVKYYAGDFKDGVDPQTINGKVARQWIFKTDERGIINFNEDYLVSGDPFYKNSQGKPTLPLGTVTIQETKPPVGYKLNPKVFVRKITSKGNVESVDTYNEPTVSEEGIKGKVKIAKKDKETNKVIKIKGTTFDIYRGSTKVETIKTDETGYATSSDLSYGLYTIKESKAPNGYLVDINQSQTISIISDKIVDTDFVDKRATVSLQLIKEDKETNTRPQGDATLEGAIYGLYAKENILDPARDGNVLYQKDSLVGQIKTDKNGQGTLDNLYFGHYYLQEIKPSTGYELDLTKYPIEASYKDDRTITIKLKQVVKETIRTGQFDLIKTITNGQESEIMEDEKGAEFVAVLKTDYEANDKDILKALEYAKANRSKKEYAVLKTNENGYAKSGQMAFGTYVIQQTKRGSNAQDTDILKGIFTFIVTEKDGKTQVMGTNTQQDSIQVGSDGKIHYHINNRPHGYHIRLMKQDLDTGRIVTFNSAKFKIKDVKGNYVTQEVGGRMYDTFVTNSKNGEIGILTKMLGSDWQIKEDDQGGVVLPLELKAGRYTLEEIAPPEGFLALEKPVAFVVEEKEMTESLPNGDPVMTIVAKNDQPKAKIIVSKTDKESKEPLSNVEYELKAQEDIVDQIDGTILYKKGEIVSTGKTNKEGKLEFTNLNMGSYILKETLTNKGYVVNSKEHVVNLKSEDTTTKEYVQSFKFENIHPTGQIHLKKTDKEEGTLLSGVVFELTAAQDIYSLDGRNTLIYKKGEKVSKDISEDGRYMTNELGEIHIENLPLGRYHIKEIETLATHILDPSIHTIDLSYDESDKLIYTQNLAIENEKVSIHTTAFNKQTKGKSFNNQKKITVTDTVVYKGLVPEKEYVLKGVLMDKSTKEPLLIDGKEIVSTQEFIAKKANDEIEINFTFDASSLKNQELVVYEKLYTKQGNNLIASHEDLESKEQTVQIMDVMIDTKAYGYNTKTNQVNLSKNTIIKDKIHYENLVPNVTYKLKGKIMDKETQKPLIIDGKEVTSQLEFTPNKSNGDIEMTFKLDTTLLEAKKLVVFETLEQDGIFVAEHTDINDQDQTISITKNPVTSTNTNMKYYVLLASVSIFAICILLIRKNKRRF